MLCYEHALQALDAVGEFLSGYSIMDIAQDCVNEVEGLMRLILWKAQPVVPYLRGGLSGVVWSETWAGTDGDLDEASGIKWGVHVGGGAQFRLPFPEINWRGRVVGDPVLDDIYIYVEGWARSASDFGSAGLDLSAFGAAVGLSLLL